MPHCQNCGGHVSRQFARVLGDNDDVVHGCPDCSTTSDRVRAEVIE